MGPLIKMFFSINIPKYAIVQAEKKHRCWEGSARAEVAHTEGLLFVEPYKARHDLTLPENEGIT